jgi:hypothetical protein
MFVQSDTVSSLQGANRVAGNGLVACAVAELKVGSLMKVRKVERTYLLEPLHKAAIAQLPRVTGSHPELYDC